MRLLDLRVDLLPVEIQQVDASCDLMQFLMQLRLVQIDCTTYIHIAFISYVDVINGHYHDLLGSDVNSV